MFVIVTSIRYPDAMSDASCKAHRGHSFVIFGLVLSKCQLLKTVPVITHTPFKDIPNC